jgi:hypothetical protein
MVDARYMRLYHRSTDGSGHTIYEYVPRRIVQAEDIEAESIKAINISAGAVTADKIFVLTLGAITANIGQLVIDTTGYIWQGTGTAAIPTTGLKIYNSGGVGKLSTYNSGVEQVTLDTDGKFKAAAGAVIMDASGISLTGGTGTANQLKWYSGADLIGRINTYVSSGVSTIEIASFTATAGTGNVITMAAGFWGYTAKSDGTTYVRVPTSTGTYQVIAGVGPGSAIFEVAAGVGTSTTSIYGGLNLGSATGAAAGQISTSGSIGIGDAVQTNIRGLFKGQDATSSNYALFANSSAGTNLFWVRNDGAVLIAKSGGAVGFYGGSPASKPTVTGAKGGNAALTSLLSALSGLGLLTDSST